MKWFILILAVLTILPSATALELYHNITMTYNNGEVILDSVSVVPLEKYDSEFYENLNEYTATLLDKDNSVLEIYFFDFNLALIIARMEDGNIIDEEIKLEHNTLSVYFPYEKDATKLIIRTFDFEELFNIELKEIEKQEDIIKESNENKIPINYIIVGIFLLVVISIIGIISRKKRNI